MRTRAGVPQQDGKQTVDQPAQGLINQEAKERATTARLDAQTAKS